MSNSNNLQPNPYEQQQNTFTDFRSPQQIQLDLPAHLIPRQPESEVSWRQRAKNEAKEKVSALKFNGLIDFWLKVFNFKGLSTRWDYFITHVVYGLISVILAFVGLIVDAVVLKGGNTVLTLTVFTILAVGFIPNLSLRVRRLRDAGYSPWWLLLHLIGFNLIPELLCLLLPTSKLVEKERRMGKW